MKISTVSQMREMDRTAITQFGIIEEILMENAGLAAFNVLADQIGIRDKTFLVVCGAGNNGGDGLVVARKILSDGGRPRVVILSDPGKFKGAAQTNFDIIARLPVSVQVIETAEAIKADLQECDAVIDAIFGTGLARDVGGKYRDVIKLINSSGKPVLSLDIPSGVHGDTGNVMGIAVKADYTATFGLPKVGNLLFPGYALGGELYVTHISFPPSLYTDDILRISVNCPPTLPPRTPEGHKGTFGDVLFIGGAAGYFGAPYFAALALLKAGGGYSRLAAPCSVTPFIANKGSEIVFVPQQETASGSMALENKEALLELSRKTDMVVMGPGLSLDEETQQLVRETVPAIDTPLLIDGDGITAICKKPELVRQRKAPTILTPHMGEMARLTGKTVAEIKADQIGVLQEAAKDLNAIIVLKGAHSLIGYPDETISVNMSGNSGMATAGSGDVLAGTIAAMFGLGLPPEDAVKKGVFLHGLSGDLASQDKGPDGMTAQDVLDYLPLAVKTDREKGDQLFREHYGIRVIS